MLNYNHCKRWDKSKDIRTNSMEEKDKIYGSLNKWAYKLNPVQWYEWDIMIW